MKLIHEKGVLPYMIGSKLHNILMYYVMEMDDLIIAGNIINYGIVTKINTKNLSLSAMETKLLLRLFKDHDLRIEVVKESEKK